MRRRGHDVLAVSGPVRVSSWGLNAKRPELILGAGLLVMYEVDSVRWLYD